MQDQTVETFGDRLGEKFSIEVEGREPYEIEVVEAVGMPGDSNTREPFSVLFRGSDELVLEQRIYRLGHADLEPMDLFLVPLGPEKDRKGTMLYEAAFS